MLGTVPADLAQYMAHILRIVQKLMYLYGWSELFDESGQIDDETTNLLTLFVGVMFGVNAAGGAIIQISKKAALNATKKLPQMALTKGIIYPIVKKIAKILGVHMTKDIFAKGVGKLIPVIGGVISGTLTLTTYKPMANRLKDYLKMLKPANVEFYKNKIDDDDDDELIICE